MVRPSRRRAFTLLELVLTMAIVVMVTALGYPAYEAMADGVRINAAVDDVRGGLAEAQARAMDEGRPYRFAIVPGQRNYRIAPDSSDYWSGGGSPTSSTPDGQAQPLVYPNQLPKGMALSLGVDGGGNTSGTDTGNTSGTDTGKDSSADVDAGAYISAAVLLPDGTARDDVDLTLSQRGTRIAIIHLRALTGCVTIQKNPTGG